MTICLVAIAFIANFLRFVVWRTRDDLLCKNCKWYRPGARHDCHNPKLGIKLDTGEVDAQWADLMRERAWNACGHWIFGGCGASGAWWEPKPEPEAPKEPAAPASLGTMIYAHPSIQKTEQS